MVVNGTSMTPRLSSVRAQAPMRSIEATDGQLALASRDAILRDLAEFMGTTPARDDITLVVIRA